MFTKTSRQDRAYYKHLKQVKRSRERQRSQIRQRAEMPSLRTPPPLQQNVQPPENQ
jgi:hypothetical protein